MQNRELGPARPGKFVRALQRARHRPHHAHHPRKLERRLVRGSAALDHRIERLAIEPFERNERHERVLRGLERADVERAHHARNQRRKPKQDLTLLLKFLQERLALLSRESARDLQALERHGGLEALVVRSVHHPEAAFGNDALHSEHGRLERADDPEDVLCHSGRLVELGGLGRPITPAQRVTTRERRRRVIQPIAPPRASISAALPAGDLAPIRQPHPLLAAGGAAAAPVVPALPSGLVGAGAMPSPSSGIGVFTTNAGLICVWLLRVRSSVIHVLRRPR